jgi:hypothetical protein
MQWPLPPEVKPVNGLVLSFEVLSNWVRSIRVLLQDASNCFYAYEIPTLQPSQGYTLLHKYCFGTSSAFPLLEKIVPDSSTNMTEVEVIYLVSLTHVAAITADTIEPITVVEVRTRARNHHSVANPPCFYLPTHALRFPRVKCPCPRSSARAISATTRTTTSCS